MVRSLSTKLRYQVSLSHTSACICHIWTGEFHASFMVPSQFAMHPDRSSRGHIIQERAELSPSNVALLSVRQIPILLPSNVLTNPTSWFSLPCYVSYCLHNDPFRSHRSFSLLYGGEEDVATQARRRHGGRRVSVFCI